MISIGKISKLNLLNKRYKLITYKLNKKTQINQYTNLKKYKKLIKYKK